MSIFSTMKDLYFKLTFLSIFTLAICGTANGDMISPGQLSKSHSELTGISNCVKCHSLSGGIEDSSCKSCHKKLMGRINSDKGFHAKVEGKCIDCHKEHKGEDYDIVQLNKEAFIHSKTGYVLLDKHKTDCNKCHKEKKTYLGLSPECLNCHADVHRKKLSEDCIRCHTFTGWKDVRFDHDKSPAFKLTGRHREAKCEKCHPRETVEEKPGYRDKAYSVPNFRVAGNFKECSGCHEDVHKGKLKEKTCSRCHSTEGWTKTTVDHNDAKLTDFRLEGKHEKVECKKCHKKEDIIGKNKKIAISNFSPLKNKECSGCHEDIHKGKLKEKTCSKCHTTEGWEKAKVDHNDAKLADFRLEGRHEKVECRLCHKKEKVSVSVNGKEEKIDVRILKPVKSGLCSDCHFDIHREQFKGKKCDSCHTVKNEWKEETFSHASNEYTGYKLEGKHEKVECEKCHKKAEVSFKEFGKDKKIAIGDFSHVENKECSGCHEDIHKGKLKEKTCSKCHTTEGWEKAKVDHNDAKLTDFRLEGKHEKVECELCHQKEKVTIAAGKDKLIRDLKPGNSGLCSDCHFDIHREQFKGQKCDTCHTVQNMWKEETFRHSSDEYAGYKLEGKHEKVECEKCHKKEKVSFKEFGKEKSIDAGSFSLEGDYKECLGCHKDKHKGEFGNICTKCHSPARWDPITYLHNSLSSELKGAHKSLECAKCHRQSGSFGKLSSNCTSCHNEPHQSQFSPFCTDCHSQDRWVPAVFNHNDTGFRLTGSHKKADCSECHTNNNFMNTSSDCFSCHESDYQTAPLHTSSGFSKECTECHSTTGSWDKASFTHSAFGFSGAHASLKNDCMTCHKDNIRLSGDDCYNCHSASGVAASKFEQTNSPSHTALNFSTSCTDCHSEFSWADANYSHQNSQPKGPHTALDCNACHSSGYPGNYAGTSPDDCYTCHAGDHTREHPSFPRDCTQCHNGSTWGGAA
ncbi:MAG: hypothetical protein Q7U10_02885, partial [Thermodesulfovibrionia bacterium]|nr:hypothetical protein [Thermodesulfovibrionia bacterium]